MVNMYTQMWVNHIDKILDMGKTRGGGMAGIIYPKVEEKRKDLGVSKERMKDKLGISYTALDNKLDGTSEFSAREIRTLAMWWNVSADELLSEAVLV